MAAFESRESSVPVPHIPGNMVIDGIPTSQQNSGVQSNKDGSATLLQGHPVRVQSDNAISWKQAMLLSIP